MIKHIWLFTVGTPKEGAFSSLGHITINTKTGTSKGLISFVAADGTWLAHATLEKFEFDDDMFSGDIGFTAIQGTPPFPLLPATVPTGSLTVGVAIPSVGVPNLFVFVGDPAPVPPQAAS